MTRKSMAFLAHYVEVWNWLLKWRLFQPLHSNPESHRYFKFLWPLYASASSLEMYQSRAFDILDHFQFGENLDCRTVMLRNYAWQFMVPQYRGLIRDRILKAVLELQDYVEVIGLGALVKDESLTRGGDWIVEALGPQLKVPIVHGDTLTAATVFKQVMSLRKERGYGPEEGVMITGSTSKIGRAVTCLLAQEGVKVTMFTLCHERFVDVRTEAGSAGSKIRWATGLSEGKSCPIWVTGKAVPRGPKLLDFVPFGADVLNFAVPNPASGKWRESRPDLSFHEGGLLAYDPEKTNLRCTMRLLPGITYACHAGTMVHANEGWTHHEVGPVDLKKAALTWEGAQKLGFCLPPLDQGPVLSGELKERQI